MRRPLSLLAIAAFLIASPAAAQQTGAGGGGSATPGTGTGLLVGQTSPTLITPVLGAATATSVNNSGAQTNSAAGAASTPAQTYSGAPYAAGSATTNFPLVYINDPAATAVNQFGAGTAFGINVKGSTTANILDLYADNVERMLLDKGGNMTTTSLTISATQGYTWNGRSSLLSPLNKEIQFSDAAQSGTFTISVPTSSVANVLQLGHLNAASPVAQTLQVQGSRGGTDTNVAGGNLSVISGLGTGSATGSTITFQTPHAGSTGTTAQTATTQLVLGDNVVQMPALAASSAATTGTVCWTTSTGNLTVDTTTTCLASDMRLKKHMVPLGEMEGLDEVMALKPFSYTLKADPLHAGRQVGLGAQDVQKVDPRLVSLYADGPDKGTPSGVRYMQLTAVLVKAVQQQQAQIAALKRQVAQLQRAHH